MMASDWRYTQRMVEACTEIQLARIAVVLC